MSAPVPLGEVFKFFEDPRNLARITPPQLRFQVTNGGNIEMRKGALIDYTIRWMGLPMKWRTLIADYQPPRYFVDEQLRGPYRYWKHRHVFTESGGLSIITDRVEYALPLGIMGRMAHALVVERQLKGIFAYRQRAIAKILGTPDVRYTEPEIRALARPES
jgi:hypothetical protein